MRAPAKGLGPREARAARARAEGTMAERDGAEGARAVRGQGQDGAIQGTGGKGAGAKRARAKVGVSAERGLGPRRGQG